MSELIEALEESNFILKALYNNQTDAILKDGIEKRLLKNAEVIARGKTQEQSNFDRQMQKEVVNLLDPEENKPINKQNEPVVAVKDLLIENGLMNEYQLNSPKNKGFITSNIEYYIQGPDRYAETLKRVAKVKDKASNLQGYIVTSLRKEFSKGGRHD